MKNVKLLSLDLKTTGLEIGKHVPISIGAVNLENGEDFYCQLIYDNLFVSPDALRINKIDIVNPPVDSLPVKEALKKFYQWVVNQYGCVVINNLYEIRCVGKQVGSFDLPMLKSIWDIYSKDKWPFSYKSIDLKTLLYVVEDVTDEVLDRFKLEPYEKLTKYLEHHALGNAWWGCFAYKIILEKLNDKK